MKKSEQERLRGQWELNDAGCWVWHGTLHREGYGKFYFRGKVWSAHRASWTIFCGEIPAGMYIDHMCRTRACVNPEHLRIVTPKENSLENSLSVTAANAKKTSCSKCGSALTPDKRGRHCEPCRLEWGRKFGSFRDVRLRGPRLTEEERERIGAFLDKMTYVGEAPLNGHGYYGVTREQYWESYQLWALGGHGWDRLQQGGTGIMAALCWYHHIHRPGSRDWRPAFIIRALLEATKP